MDKLKLILDENISWRLKRLLPGWTLLPVNEITSTARLSDREIWLYASQNNYHIITFDEDFSDLQTLYNFPPKVIWLRSGNTITQEIAQLLIREQSKIISFLHDDESGILELF